MDAATSSGTEKFVAGGEKPTATWEEDDEDMSSGEDDEDMSNVFTVKLGTLRCDICFHLFKSYVYTCDNGHAVCGKCGGRNGRKCAICSEPIGYYRCRAMEKILAGMTQPCKFRKNGCTETVRFTERRRHEEECGYSPYMCLFHRCSFVGHLYGHILEKHATAASTIDSRGLAQMTMAKDEIVGRSQSLHALLHPDGKTVYFLLNRGDVLTGLSLAVAVVYPQSDQAKQVDKCAITFTRDTMPGSVSLSGILDVQSVSWEHGIASKLSLFVSNALVNALCGDTSSTFTVKLSFYSNDLTV